MRLIVVGIFIPVMALLGSAGLAGATSGALKQNSIKTCPDGMTYGKHGNDNHWHVAEKSGTRSGWSAVGSPLAGDPCPDDAGKPAQNSSGQESNESGSDTNQAVESSIESVVTPAGEPVEEASGESAKEAEESAGKPADESPSENSGENEDHEETGNALLGAAALSGAGYGVYKIVHGRKRLVFRK